MAFLYLSELDPSVLRVELYADPSQGRPAECMPASCEDSITGAINGYFYSTEVKTVRPTSDYTYRVTPYHPEAQLPLEKNHILWQK